MRKYQQGLSMISVMFVVFIVIFLAILTMRTVPAVIEYFNITSAVKSIGSGEAAQYISPADIRRAFSARAQIDDIETIKAEDLVIDFENGSPVISFAYRKEIHVAGNVSLCIDFEGRSR